MTEQDEGFAKWYDEKIKKKKKKKNTFIKKIILFILFNICKNFF